MMLYSMVCGPYQTQVYCLKAEDAKLAVLIDAAPESFAALQEYIKGCTVHLFLTHGHWDHIADAIDFQRQCNAKVYFHPAEKAWLNPEQQKRIIPRYRGEIPFVPVKIDQWVQDGASIQIGPWCFQILHLPGHSAGSIGLYEPHEALFFSGDTLFKSGVGRTDLFEGSQSDLEASLKKIWRTLPPNTVAYPGHGPSTTIAVEKERHGGAL